MNLQTEKMNDGKDSGMAEASQVFVIPVIMQRHTGEKEDYHV